LPERRGSFYEIRYENDSQNIEKGMHGLAPGDFELALRALLGDGAPLSGPTVARLKEKWQEDLAVWQTRRMEELDYRGIRFEDGRQVQTEVAA
jgi:hypothetical protein